MAESKNKKPDQKDDTNVLTLVDSGRKVRLKGMGLDEADEFLEKREQAMGKSTKAARQLMREVLVSLYGQKLLDEIKGSNRDVVQLYNATIKFTYALPGELGNS